MQVNVDAVYAPVRAASLGERPELTALHRGLVLGDDVFDLDGKASKVAGHLSAHAPGAGSFWSDRYDLTFGKVGGRELVEADFELDVPLGGKGPQPAYALTYLNLSGPTGAQRNRAYPWAQHTCGDHRGWRPADVRPAGNDDPRVRHAARRVRWHCARQGGGVHRVRGALPAPRAAALARLALWRLV